MLEGCFSPQSKKNDGYGNSGVLYRKEKLWIPDYPTVV